MVVVIHSVTEHRTGISKMDTEPEHRRETQQGRSNVQEGRTEGEDKRTWDVQVKVLEHMA